MSSGSNAPRNPRDLQALLKFCLETTKNEDAPASSSAAAPMDPERQRWLQEALSSMTVDVFQELAKCIEILSDESAVADVNADVSRQLYAFDCVEDWVGQIDMANNFHKLGGFVALRLCLASPHDSVQAGACHIIAEIAQNNPYCQERFLGEGLFATALALLDGSESLQVRTKALYAVSCIARDYETGQRELISVDGLSSVMKAIRTGDERLVTKSAFLLSSLLTTSEEARRICTDMGFCQMLVSLLTSGTHDPSHEQLSRALLLLVRDNEAAAGEARGLHDADGRNSLQQFLNERIAMLADKEECEEETEYCRELLKILFPAENEDKECVER